MTIHPRPVRRDRRESTRPYAARLLRSWRAQGVPMFPDHAQVHALLDAQGVSLPGGADGAGLNLAALATLVAGRTRRPTRLNP